MGGELQPDASWAAMSWEGAHLNTLIAGSRLTLAEKVAWLEAAHRAAEHLSSQVGSREDGAPSTRPTRRA